MSYQCPVCGFGGLSAPPTSPEGSPSFEICPSCGFEFGVTDGDEGFSYKQWRERWIAGGLRWWSESVPQPPGWDPVLQLASLIPDED